EWLVTNGLGGYASGTVAGACTRRYHGLLIAALPAPLGRRVMFNHLAEEFKFEDRSIVRLDTLELSDAAFEPHVTALTEFRVESGVLSCRPRGGRRSHSGGLDRRVGPRSGSRSCDGSRRRIATPRTAHLTGSSRGA